MKAIARELETSRSSVSRLLSYARHVGLVDVRVSSPFENDSQIEESIRRHYQVSAHIVPMPKHLGEIERLNRVATAAAKLLTQYIDSNMIVGIAWGSTLSAISRNLAQKETHNTTFVQLNGAGNASTTGVDYASEILQRFGRAFHAHVEQFPVPAFFDNPATKQAMWQERSTQNVLDLQRRMDLAVFGLGSPISKVPSRVYTAGYLDTPDYTALRNESVVGDIATVFFREDGSWRDVALNDRATGPDLDHLQRTPRRVCTAVGLSKLTSLRGALNAGFMTDVVIDESLAHGLMNIS